MTNLLKSLFISLYATYSVSIAAVSVVKLTFGWDTGWLGVAIAHIPVALLFLRLMILRDKPRLHPWMPLVSTASGVGAILAIAGGGLTSSPGLLGAGGLIGYVIYLAWYSRFPHRGSRALTRGSPLPVFTATDIGGAAFNSTDLLGSPAVLLFFRGNWCPLCMAQVSEIAAQYRSLAERGIRVVLISPQPEKNSQRLATRFDAPMTFLVDEGNHVARQLGIAARFGLPAGMQLLGYRSETVLPTVIVVDKASRIVLADQTDNYRVRPEPSTFIAALDNV